MIEYLNNLDTSLLLWLNGFHNSFFDTFMCLVSNKWVWVPMYFAIFIVNILHIGLRRQLLFVLATFGIAFAITDFTCAEIIRPLVDRPRPSNLESGIGHLVHIVDDYRGGRYGFPSCHAANSFMLATLCMLLFKNNRLTFFLYSWAFLHSYSRTYLGVHYPGDILFGALIGSLIALVCYKAYTRFYHPNEENKYRHLPLISCTGVTILGILFFSAFFVRFC